jgi:biotin carboxyl carrier protein
MAAIPQPPRDAQRIPLLIAKRRETDMRFIATVAGVRHVVEVDANGSDRRITLDGRELAVNWRSIGPRHPQGNLADHYGLLIGQRSYDAYVRALDTTDETAPSLDVIVDGRSYAVAVQDARVEAVAGIAGGAHAAGEATLRAPMPGLVRNVLVAAGDEVERGQIVVVLEAMKMENDLAAPRAGAVKAVGVATGQTVNQGDVLVTIGDSAANQTEDAE